MAPGWSRSQGAAVSAEAKKLADAQKPALQKLLDKHKVSGSGDDVVFKTYDKLSDAEVKELSNAVNALSEPLSKLTAAVTL